MPQPFYHRAWELAELNAMTSEKPAAFVLVYGKRTRVPLAANWSSCTLDQEA